MTARRLDAEVLAGALDDLVAADGALSALIERNGPPPLWLRPEGFATLVKMVLEQQVSLASAAAAYGRLESSLGSVTPDGFLTLDEAELLGIGFSRQKAGYCRGLAAGIIDGSIDLGSLGDAGDDEARRRLMDVRGIGPWTADVYLMFALGRPDVWPPGDRALEVSLGSLLGRDPVPTHEAVAHAERWRPWRSVAARVLWHDYLGGAAGPA